MSLVIIIAGLFFLFRTKEIKQPHGILAPKIPIQTKLKKAETWQVDDYNFNAVLHFETTAKVLSVREYGSDDLSVFCPMDLALGWGKMADQQIVDQLDIKQQHRWYVWQTKKFPIPKKEIEISSSNVHIIPANENIEDILSDIIRGNIISISGKLVNVNEIGKEWTWKSSTKRDDTGGGACEILWVEEVYIIK